MKKMMMVTAALIGAVMMTGCETFEGLGGKSTPTTLVQNGYSNTMSWSTAGQWDKTTLDGLVSTIPGVRLASGRQSGVITSQPVTLNSYDDLIASWNTTGEPDGHLKMEVRHQKADGSWTKWYNLGEWSPKDGRTSVDDQKDADGTVWTDTNHLYSKFSTYQWRATLSGGITLRQLSVTTSDSDLAGKTPDTNTAHSVWGKVLDVPLRSQMIYPDGGEVWCSPTSTSMVMVYYGVNVTVPEAAAGTYDTAYDGTGNWPFNVAYAAQHGLSGFVARLVNLDEAERYIAAGIPLVASIAWSEGDLPAAPIASTDGHLLVIVGFDAQGNVVVNDPAAPDDAGVRRTYPRADFEKLWQEASGGTVYVIYKAGVSLPLPPLPS